MSDNPKRKPLVIIESPFNGPTPDIIQRNIKYARRALRDSVLRGEAPIASHLLFTQDGVLDDKIPEERQLGMAAGHAWMRVADVVAVYIDYGISPGMEKGIAEGRAMGCRIDRRSIG